MRKIPLWLPLLGLLIIAVPVHFRPPAVTPAPNAIAVPVPRGPAMNRRLQGPVVFDSNNDSFPLLMEPSALAATTDALKKKAPARLDLAAWVQRDAREAARFVESLTPDQGREDILTELARLWAARNPLDALAWADQLNDAHERQIALAAGCSQWAQQNSPEAMRMAEQFGLGDNGGAVLADLAQQWASTDTASALAWAIRRPSSSQREQLIEVIAFVLAQKDSPAAARLVMAQIPSGPMRTEAVSGVVCRWTTRDAGAALAWVAALPEGPEQERAIDVFAGMNQPRSLQP